MSDVEWTAYDPDWVYLSEDDPRWAAMDENQQALYQLYSYRNYVRRSPLDFALAFTEGAFDYPHIRFLSDTIVALIEDRLYLPSGEVANNLIVTMPPRHGKSYLISEHVTPWYLSRYPNNEVVLTSYDGDFAAGWGKKAKDALTRAAAALGISVDPESKANSRWHVKGRRGSMQTAGTGGPITGKGGHLLIGDDWVKNAEEANSPAWRQKAWDWVLSTFLTRRNAIIDPKTGMKIGASKTILLMTRWNDDDPVGRLLKQEPGKWAVVDLPAIARENDALGREPGEALDPARYPLVDLMDMQETFGAYWFSALYQGRPTPEGGGLFNESTFRYWRTPGGHGNEAIGRAYEPGSSYVLLDETGQPRYVSKKDVTHFITVDLAISEKKSGDWTVFGSWASSPEGDLILTGLRRVRIIGPDHLDELESFVTEMRLVGQDPKFVGIEHVTFGVHLVQVARRAATFLVRELTPDDDKYTRAIPASTIAKAGQLYIPSSAPWLDEWKAEHAGFPNYGHDDQVDVSSYAALVHVEMLSGRRKGNGDPRRPGGLHAASSLKDRLDAYTERKQAAKNRTARQASNRL